MPKQFKPKVEMEVKTEKEFYFSVPFTTHNTDICDVCYDEDDECECCSDEARTTTDYNYKLEVRLDSDGCIMLQAAEYECEEELSIDECEGIVKFFTKIIAEAKKIRDKK